MKLAKLSAKWLLCLGLFAMLAPAQAPVWVSIEIRVRDPNGQPLPGAVARLRTPIDSIERVTDPSGRVVFRVPVPTTGSVEISKPGFLTVEHRFDLPVPEPLNLEITMPPAEPLRESVTVTAESPAAAPPVEAHSSSSGTELKALASRPGSLRDALPLIPGITRTPEGKLRISDNPEHRSAFLINSIDVTDPATGEFGSTIPIDAVATVDVYRSPFLAEFGRFTAGVVAVETAMGSNQWRWELNDPTPELRIRSKRLRGIRASTPRLSVSGPLVRNHLFLTQAVEFRLNKTPVFTLPFPHNEERKQSLNALTQLDCVPSSNHWLRITAHAVPQRHAFARLSFQWPRPVTPTYAGGEHRLLLTDRWSSPSWGTLETALSASQVSAKVWGQGDQALVLRPVQHEGNYFMELRRLANRYQWIEIWSPPVVETRGQHRFKLGIALLYTRVRGSYQARPVYVRGLRNQLLQQITFTNRPPFRLSEIEWTWFAQDHWVLGNGFTLELGLRADGQSATGLAHLAPRFALSWSPSMESKTVLRAGYGWFYDRVPLVVSTFEHYPERAVTRFDQPVPHSWAYQNVLGVGLASTSALIWGQVAPGAFAPRSRTWQMQVLHRPASWAQFRITYIHMDSDGLIILQPRWDRPRAVLELTDAGRARHRQFEALARFTVYRGGQLIASYIRSFTRGNLNEFSEFLGNFPAPLVRPDLTSYWPGTIPHRFLSWGVIPLTGTVQLSPVIEYRTGFPYAVVNEAQDYVGIPNTQRFPNFFSLDLRLSKDIQWRKYRLRISLSSYNLTNHFNPDTVRSNTADSLFGEFLGNHDRRFRLDLDVLF